MIADIFLVIGIMFSLVILNAVIKSTLRDKRDSDDQQDNP